jgi:hypothetical protein
MNIISHILSPLATFAVQNIDNCRDIRVSLKRNHHENNRNLDDQGQGARVL